MRDVWLAQINYEYGGTHFLPYSVGQLWSQARAADDLMRSYRLGGWLYKREPIDSVVDRIAAGSLVAMSCYLWNWRYNLALAHALKRRHANIMIVLGGPEVPRHGQDLLCTDTSIDILVHGEAEDTFVELLRCLRDDASLAGVAGISFRQGSLVTQTAQRQRVGDLSRLKSPYLDGTFDELMRSDHGIRWQASQETHRGCPYSCTFCDWGSAVYTKVRRFDDDRIKAELDWFGINHMELLYNCDANYGMLPRDLELTDAMIAVHQRHGYPRKFRASYAKRNGDRVQEIARKLHAAGMSKGVTVSMQSLDPHTLGLIKRDNIAVEDLPNLLSAYHQHGIPTYSEIIVGLPGETMDTFIGGIEDLLVAGQHDNINIYMCMLLRNSELAEPANIAMHGIISAKIPLASNHGSPDPSGITEYHDVVIATNSMPHDDWLQCMLLSWTIQVLHCFGLTQHIAKVWHASDRRHVDFYMGIMAEFRHSDTLLGHEMRDYLENLSSVLRGAAWRDHDAMFGDNTWPIEELGWLRIMLKRELFYQELEPWLVKNMPGIDVPQLIDISMKTVLGPDDTDDGMGVYDASILHADAAGKVMLQFSSEKYYHGDVRSWAREIAWYGRKQALHKRHMEKINDL